MKLQNPFMQPLQKSAKVSPWLNPKVWGSALLDSTRELDGNIGALVGSVADGVGSAVDLTAAGLNKVTGGLVPRDSFGGSRSIRRGTNNIGMSTEAADPSSTQAKILSLTGDALSLAAPAKALSKAPRIVAGVENVAKEGINVAFNQAATLRHLKNPAVSRFVPSFAKNTTNAAGNIGQRANAPFWSTLRPSAAGASAREAAMIRPGALNFAKDTLKNRAIVLGSSAASVGNHKLLLDSYRNAIGATESQFMDPMSSTAQEATTWASVAPYLFSRSGFLPFAAEASGQLYNKFNRDPRQIDKGNRSVGHNPYSAVSPIYELVANRLKQNDYSSTPVSSLSSPYTDFSKLLSPEAARIVKAWHTGWIDNAEQQIGYRTPRGGRYYAPDYSGLPNPALARQYLKRENMPMFDIDESGNWQYPNVARQFPGIK